MLRITARQWFASVTTRHTWFSHVMRYRFGWCVSDPSFVWIFIGPGFAYKSRDRRGEGNNTPVQSKLYDTGPLTAHQEEKTGPDRTRPTGPDGNRASMRALGWSVSVGKQYLFTKTRPTILSKHMYDAKPFYIQPEWRSARDTRRLHQNKYLSTGYYSRLRRIARWHFVVSKMRQREGRKITQE